MTGRPLEAAEAEIIPYHHIVKHQFKHGVVANMIEIYQQAVANLIGRTPDPCRLKGEHLDEDQLLPALRAVNEKTRVVHIYIQRLSPNYLFHDYERAAENAISADKLLSGTQGTYNIPVFYFYDTLTHLALLPDKSPQDRERALERVTANLDKLKRWSQSAPRSHLQKYYLVEAEHARVTDRAGEAREYYDLAITAAQENGYLNEEALAYEVAGVAATSRAGRPKSRRSTCVMLTMPIGGGALRPRSRIWKAVILNSWRRPRAAPKARAPDLPPLPRQSGLPTRWI